MLSSRMQTLPVDSTFTFRNSFTPASICHYDEATGGEIDIESSDICFPYESSILQTSNTTLPARRLRRILSRSLSAGSNTKHYKLFPEYQKRNTFSDDDDSCLDNTVDETSESDISFTKPSQKYFMKHKLKKQSSLPFNYFRDTDYKERNNLRLKIIPTLRERFKKYQSHNFSSIPYLELNKSIFEKQLDVLNQKSLETIDDEVNHYHCYGYASDDSIAETTIHVDIDKSMRDNKHDHNTPEELNSFNVDLPKHGIRNLYANKERKKDLFLNFRSYNKQRGYHLMPLHDTKIDNYHDDKEYLERETKRIGHVDKFKSHKIRKVNLNSSVSERSPVISYKTDVGNPFKNIGSDHTKAKTKTYSHYKLEKDNNEQCQIEVVPRSIPKNRREIESYHTRNAHSPLNPLDANNHLDSVTSKMANDLSVGLSPTNLGSSCGVLASVAPHLPPVDTYHSTTTEQLMSHHTSTGSSENNSKSKKLEQRDRHHKSMQKYKYATSGYENSDESAKPQNSNDYGGRENGRNNNQTQPLERRESRRGQFTRSLSNADVPPDEKAGK